MSYTTVEKQIHSVPEEYLDEIAEFIDYVLFKVNKKEEADTTNDTSGYFGSIPRTIEGLEVQRGMRDEWD